MELVRSTSLDRRRNRVVVYGSRGSGAGEFARKFRELLEAKGIRGESVSFVRSAEPATIRQAFFGLRGEGDQETIPRGVVTFPVMRLYDGPHGGMDVPTYGYEEGKTRGMPIEQIQGLCDEHGVMLIKVEEDMNPRLLREKLSLMPPVPQI